MDMTTNIYKQSMKRLKLRIILHFIAIPSNNIYILVTIVKDYRYVPFYSYWVKFYSKHESHIVSEKNI